MFYGWTSDFSSIWKLTPPINQDYRDAYIASINDPPGTGG